MRSPSNAALERAKKKRTTHWLKSNTVIGSDIKRIGLEEQYTALQARTAALIRQATAIADARQ